MVSSAVTLMTQVLHTSSVTLCPPMKKRRAQHNASFFGLYRTDTPIFSIHGGQHCRAIVDKGDGFQ